MKGIKERERDDNIGVNATLRPEKGEEKYVSACNRVRMRPNLSSFQHDIAQRDMQQVV